MQSYQRFHASVIRTSRVSQTPPQTPPPYFYQWVSHGKNGLGAIVYKWPTFTFVHESGYTLAFANRIAHKGLHGETRAFRMGVVSLPSERFTRFGNPAWPSIRTANFAAFEPWSRALSKNAESLGTAMRSCVSLFRGVAAPLGCVIFFAFVEIAVFTPCA